MSDVLSCWISSIVQLPNLYDLSDRLQGLQTTYGIDENTGEPTPETLMYTGRNLARVAVVYKYKLGFAISHNGSRPHIVEVIGISNIDFDARSIMSIEVNQGLFFPIYMKSGSNCYLFVESINDLLKEPGSILDSDLALTGQVMSPATLLSEVLEYRYDKSISRDTNTELELLKKFSSVDRPDNVIDLIYSGLMERNLDDLYIRYLNPLHAIPRVFYDFANVRTVGHLKHFLSPYGQVPSDIAARCMGISKNLPYLDNLRYKLHITNAIPTVSTDVNYSGDYELSITGKWLAGIFMAESSDMEFTMQINPAVGDKIADLYARTTDVSHNFHKSWELLRWSKDYLYFLDTAFALFQYKKPQLLVNRSWLEDLIIRDPDTKEILIYVDMVFWMIACSSGLINKSVLDYIKLY